MKCKDDKILAWAAKTSRGTGPVGDQNFLSACPNTYKIAKLTMCKI
jgi:hypothetical protein